ncbi:MAG TPA: peptidylprolyl isomerase [Vicinamibacterales bacterium]|nr:peptidylprolyl isomerase [Vicinamibacterales bacterium]
MRKPAVWIGLVVTLVASVLSAQEGPAFTKEARPSNLVRIETTLGNIDIEVDPVHAPITSANFLRYVSSGSYDGGEFYRAARPDTYHAVLPNRPPMQLIEARIPSGAQAYPPIPLERTSVTGLHHVAGTVAMGRNDDQPNSATFDFYILLNDQPSLDFGGKRFDDAQGTAAFGKVVAGMDVVRAINQQAVASREATADNPLVKTQNLDPPIRINTAYRVRPPGPPHVATFTKDIVNGPRPEPSSIRLGPNMIGGVVTEITRAPLEGATVTLRGPALTAPRVITTDHDGKYQFADVAPGTYTLTVEATPGFKKMVRANIVMVSGFSARIDCLLEWSGGH